MNRSRQGMHRLSPLVRVVVLMFACVFLASAWLFAQPAAPEPESLLVPGVPGTDPMLEPPQPIDAPTPPDDSIYAREITVDRSGVTIVDREGRHYSLAAQDSSFEPHGRPPRDDRVRQDIIHVLTDVIVVEEDDSIYGDVVCVFAGDIEILGHVEGMVFTLFGNINVEGSVGDAAVAPFGSVRIGSNGKVSGDVIASDIAKEPGGRIGGYRNELFFKFLGDAWEPRGTYWAQTTLTVIVFLKMLFWVFLVLLAHALAARNVAKVKAKIQTSFFKSFLMGVLVQILFLPVMLLLIMTIVGIPVAVFLLPLMIVAAVILSQAAIGLLLGEKIDENTGLKFATPLGKTLAGLMAMQIIPLLAVIFAWGTGLDLLGGSFRMVAFSMVLLSILFGYVVVTLGTGAVAMTRFGTRPKDPQPEAVAPEADDASHPKATPLPHTQTGDSGTAPVVG